MKQEFKEKEYLVVSPNISWESGDCVVIINANNTKTLKKTGVHEEQRPTLLRTENNKYPTVVLTKEDKSRIIGKIVSKIYNL